MRKATIAHALVLLLINVTLSAQHESRVVAAFRRLQAQATTDRAAKDLLALGKADPEARKYLAANLLALIDRGASGEFDCWHCWQNGAALAGQLKLVEAIKPLSRWISVSDGTLTMYRVLTLRDRPAARALVDIGNPAIPDVVTILVNEKASDRDVAVSILREIHTTKAKQALQTQRNREQDAKLRSLIAWALDNWSKFP